VLSSSSKAEKHEAKFVARLDVLTERLDTLASTVATTASAIAKKDGEIASLRRDLQARDEAIQALAAQARAPQQAVAAAPAVEPGELRSLRNAVAALTKEHAEGPTTEHVQQLSAKLEALAQQVGALPTGTPGAAGPDLEPRMVELEAKIEAVRALAEQAPAAPDHTEELLGMLAALRSQVEAVAGLHTAEGQRDEGLDERLAAIEERLTAITAVEERLAAITAVEERLAELAAIEEKLAGVTEVEERLTALTQIEERLTAIDAAADGQAQRVDALAASVESALIGVADKERELAALHQHFTESSTRVESVVDDIRQVLSMLPELGSPNVDDLTAQVHRLASRVERVETSDREELDAHERAMREFADRFEGLEQQLETVAAEVARAKTLWPVALRSLEARLDAVSPHPRRTDATGDAGGEPADDAPSDDLLAGLRNSLQAMESVAAEMARASDVLSADDESAPEPLAASGGGGSVVPLRSSDP
jgi:DNA repair exonuclease SbcCD ATPase subunit